MLTPFMPCGAKLPVIALFASVFFNDAAWVVILAVVCGISNFIDTDELALVSGATDVGGVMGLTSVATLSYLMFNLFTPPCFAAIGLMNSEMESAKWLWGGVGFQFGMGFVVSFLTYQIGTLITTGTVGVGLVPGLIAVAAIFLIPVVIVLLFRPTILSSSSLVSENKDILSKGTYSEPEDAVEASAPEADNKPEEIVEVEVVERVSTIPLQIGE